MGDEAKRPWSRWWRWLLPVLGIALVGHGFYWYRPRERPAVPLATGGPAELLTSEGYDAALWLPFPHQNLGALEGAVPELPRLVQAAARLLGGRGEAQLPVFGPFALPPSSEMTIAFDREGGRVEAAAEVYPSLALLAKLAGKLAGNPWLAGGEVESGGRRLTVSWQDSLWRVRSEGLAASGGSVPLGSAGETPALGLLRVARPASGLPVGTYAFERTGNGFLVSSRSGWKSPLELGLAESDAAAVAYVAAPSGERLGALFDSRLSLVPRLAAFHQPGKKRWKLPAEGLLELAGDLPQGEVSGWRIVAVDEQAYNRAAALAPRVAPLSGGPLSLGLWLRPAEARVITDELAKNLKKIPVLGEEPARRFADMTTLLAALERFERVTAVVGKGPGELFVTFDTPGSIP